VLGIKGLPLLRCSIFLVAFRVRAAHPRRASRAFKIASEIITVTIVHARMPSYEAVNAHPSYPAYPRPVLVLSLYSALISGSVVARFRLARTRSSTALYTRARVSVATLVLWNNLDDCARVQGTRFTTRVVSSRRSHGERESCPTRAGATMTATRTNALTSAMKRYDDVAILTLLRVFSRR